MVQTRTVRSVYPEVSYKGHAVRLLKKVHPHIAVLRNDHQISPRFIGGCGEFHLASGTSEDTRALFWIDTKPDLHERTTLQSPFPWCSGRPGLHWWRIYKWILPTTERMFCWSQR